jgi:transposase-like protein
MVYHLQVELSRRVRSDGGARRHGRTYIRFFKKAIGNNEVPEKITLDGSRASHQAVAELKAEGILPALTLVRASKYLE